MDNLNSVFKITNTQAKTIPNITKESENGGDLTSIQEKINQLKQNINTESEVSDIDNGFLLSEESSAGSGDTQNLAKQHGFFTGMGILGKAKELKANKMKAEWIFSGPVEKSIYAANKKEMAVLLMQKKFWNEEANKTYPPESTSAVAKLYKEIADCEKIIADHLSSGPIGSAFAGLSVLKMAQLKEQLKTLEKPIIIDDGGLVPPPPPTPGDETKDFIKTQQTNANNNGDTAIDGITDLEKQLNNPDLSDDEKAAIQVKIDNLKASSEFWQGEEKFWNTVSKLDFPEDEQALANINTKGTELAELETMAAMLLENGSPEAMALYANIQKEILGLQNEILQEFKEDSPAAKNLANADEEGNEYTDDIGAIRKKLADPNLSPDEKAKLEAELAVATEAQSFWAGEENFWNGINKLGYPAQDMDQYMTISKEIEKIEKEINKMYSSGKIDPTKMQTLTTQLDSQKSALNNLYQAKM